MDEENVVYIQNEVLTQSLKKNEIMSFVGKWIELENILLSEIRQIQKVKGWILLYVETREKNGNTRNFMKIEETSRVEEGDQEWEIGREKEGSREWSTPMYAMCMYELS